MGRLTYHNNDGVWGINGLPWEKLSIGQEITPEVWRNLYGCLCKLKNYEDTGLSPEDVERVNDFEQTQACKYMKRCQEQQKQISEMLRDYGKYKDVLHVEADVIRENYIPVGAAIGIVKNGGKYDKP